jgi:hypothetical protein
LRRLLSHQVHDLNAEDIEVLVQVTEGMAHSCKFATLILIYEYSANTINRLLRFRYNSPSKRRRHGPPPQPR